MPHNLQGQLTSFVGRGPEREQAAVLLSRHRLVTLTGPGGAGKTRLAAELAAELTAELLADPTAQLVPEAADRPPAADQAEPYTDGVWWVDLAVVGDGAGGNANTAVAEVTAEAVGAPDLGTPLRALTTYLADRRALLCLDNAEHLLDAVAGVVETVLRSCPAVTVLATSREPLGVPGEAVLAVPPLSDEDALALFVDRARLAQPSFVLDEAAETAVRSIATHLDGIPLALELAAAWVRTLTPRQIEAGLDDRFALLVRGPRGAQRRQRTLAGSIDWSHALLDDVERAVFRRLAVFEGGFGVPAVRELCAGGPVPEAEVLPALGRLVDKSLVATDEHGGELRYRLLETIRAYAAARLAEAGEERRVRDRHLVWCLQFAEAAEADRERDSDGWRRALLAEYDNLRAGLEWGLADQRSAKNGDSDDGVGRADRADRASRTDRTAHTDLAAGRRLAASLAWFWHFSRRGRDGLVYLRQAIDHAPHEHSRLQARLLTGLALVADTASPLDVEHDAAERALDLATEVGDEGLRALCLNLSAVGSFYTDFDTAWDLCEQARAATEAGGNDFARGAAQALQSVILHLRDRHAEAEALMDQTVLNRLRHHRGVLSTVLVYHADGAFALGDMRRALDLAAQAVLVAEPLDDYLRVGMAQAVLARIKALTGDVDGAVATIAPVRRLLAAADGDVFVPFLDQAIAVVEARGGEPRAAIPWLRRAAASTDRGLPTWIAGTALPGLGAALAADGRRDEAAEALATALTVTRRLNLPGPLAQVYAAQAEAAAADHPDGLVRATELQHAALALHVDHNLRAFQPDDLEALARYGAALRPTLDDVRILHAAQTARAAMGLPRTVRQQEAAEATERQLRQALGDPAYTEAAAAGARLTLDQAVTRARRARGSRGRPSTGWPSLTPTELEVVRLVAEGLTNPEIAARLFISRGTVKTHLSHIFAKLDTVNRTELSAVATSRGLSG
ncbi:helix-turn-helix transcriptional regulator [Catenulispora yoronensis]|uniref:helix-turn-helix transcriptional regulator n=1 Tax=Catenulispora yoronensis TaxID=450799 RepID=UPI0031DBB30C